MVLPGETQRWEPEVVQVKSKSKIKIKSKIKKNWTSYVSSTSSLYLYRNLNLSLNLQKHSVAAVCLYRNEYNTKMMTTATINSTTK